MKARHSIRMITVVLAMLLLAQPIYVIAATEETVDQWTRVVSGVGFPIAIALYLLIRMESVIMKLTDAVTKFTTVLAQKGIKIE